MSDDRWVSPLAEVERAVQQRAKEIDLDLGSPDGVDKLRALMVYWTPLDPAFAATLQGKSFSFDAHILADGTVVGHSVNHVGNLDGLCHSPQRFFTEAIRRGLRHCQRRSKERSRLRSGALRQACGVVEIMLKISR